MSDAEAPGGDAPPRLASDAGNGALVIRRLPGGPADLSRADWERCRSASGADPLFMGRHWMSVWWDVFGAPEGADWLGAAVEDDAGEIVGVCPVFRQRGTLRGTPIPVHRLGVLGGFFRGPGTVLTQYNQLLGDVTARPELLARILDYLDGLDDWSEMCLQLAADGSEALTALRAEAARRRWYVRVVPSLPSYLVRTGGTFAEYVASRSPSTRRRLLYQRRRLEQSGRFEFTYVEPAASHEALAKMNELYADRAGAPAFDARTMAFHERFIGELPEWGALRLSLISVDDRVVSVNYAVRVRDREYGIALGFDDRFDNRISLGTLHLGYALEDAWRDGVASYDLMTSARGSQEWKARLATSTIPLVGIQIVRRSWLAALYHVHDRFSSPWSDVEVGLRR